jgi:small-conductance mechanosensitive channel
MIDHTSLGIGVRVFVVPFALSLLVQKQAMPQIPGLSAPAPAVSSESGEKAADAKDKPKAAAASTGPITLKQQVPDQSLQRFLAKFLPKYPGVRQISVAVDDGVVTLPGQVEDDDTLDEITDVVKRVEGVRLVMNRMDTDDKVMTAWQFAASELGKIADYLRRKWLLMLLALAFVTLSAVLARLIAARSETMLAPFFSNVLLRSVAGSVISSLVVLGGVMLALAALRLTHMVLSIVGVASIVGLAVGFAFRDITENFIASVLLGVRRPFQVGDYITVAAQTGVVKSLNTRATVLVTLEGNHVRIPNATVFKEIMVNSTASPSSRSSFDVVIPNEASLADATQAINRGLRETKGVLADPPPRALIEALEPETVRIRAYFWAPSRNVDGFLLQSEAKLKTKVALQRAGVIGGKSGAIPMTSDDGGHSSNGLMEPSSISPAQAVTNRRRDEWAASAAGTGPAGASGAKTPVDRVLEQPESRVTEEGTNLLQGARTE